MRARQQSKAAPDRTKLMLERVRASGLKLTPQRMAIVCEIASDPTHPTAQELFERLRPGLPTMSFATVYNTLDTLAEAGLCAALSLAPGASRFDPNMAPHHHAVCDRCGLVRDVGVSSVGASPDARGPHAPRLPLRARTDDGSARPSRAASDDVDEAVASAAPGFHVRSVERIYRGLCGPCATEAGGRSKTRA